MTYYTKVKCIIENDRRGPREEECIIDFQNISNFKEHKKQKFRDILLYISKLLPDGGFVTDYPIPVDKIENKSISSIVTAPLLNSFDKVVF